MRIVPFALVLLAVTLPVAARAQSSAVAAADSVPSGAVVVDLDSLTTKPELRNRAAIARLMSRHFPRELREGGARGRTMVAFVVDPGGVPRLVTITGSSGYTDLDEAAVLVVRAMRFSPPLLNGAAVWVRLSFPVTFEQMR
jgi:TonB family protein